MTRLGLGIVLSMLVMGFSLPLYTDEVYGGSSEPSAAVGQLVSLLRYASLLLTSVVFILLGMPILTSALTTMREGNLTADALVVIGVAAAIVYSYVATFRESGGTYFETTCMVLVLFTLGRYLEALGKARASHAIQSIDHRLPEFVEVTREGQRQIIPSAQLIVGDRIHVAAGQMIPADGTILSGSAHVDLQSLTGESAPLVVSEGDPVRAGTLNLDGLLQVLATEVGPESTLGRLTTLLIQARRSKGRYQLAADRAVSLFVPAVILLSIATALFHFVNGRVEPGILSGLAVLLISCPCALGIATPMAVWIGLGCAARQRVLFKSGAALETFACVRAIAFDKTGTLTTRVPNVETICNGAARDGRVPELLAVAAGLAKGAQHVYSEAIAKHVEELGLSAAHVESLRVIPGAGVQGRFSGRTSHLGSDQFMRSVCAVFDASLQAEAARIHDSGRGLTCLAVDGRVEVLFSFQEELRPEAKAAIAALQNQGCSVRVLTGDHTRHALRVSAELGIPAAAMLLPARKLEVLNEMKNRFGWVAMVGDGINDGPALAGADIGIAMGCGAGVSREAADVCLLGSDLSKLPWTLQLARRTLRIIRFNLFWAFAFNAVGVPLAMFGKLSPIFAAAAMVLGSLTVVGNALRLEKSSGVSA